MALNKLPPTTTMLVKIPDVSYLEYTIIAPGVDGHVNVVFEIACPQFSGELKGAVAIIHFGYLKNTFAGANSINQGKFQAYNITDSSYHDIFALDTYPIALSTSETQYAQERGSIQWYTGDPGDQLGDYIQNGHNIKFCLSGMLALHDTIVLRNPWVELIFYPS